MNLFDWNEAREKGRENQSRVSTMAHLFSSLHFNMGRLLDDPIQHLLSVSFFQHFTSFSLICNPFFLHTVLMGFFNSHLDSA